MTLGAARKPLRDLITSLEGIYCQEVVGQPSQGLRVVTQVGGNSSAVQRNKISRQTNEIKYMLK